MKQTRRSNADDQTAKQPVSAKENIAAEENLKVMEAETADGEFSNKIHLAPEQSQEASKENVDPVIEPMMGSAKETLEQASQTFETAKQAYGQALGTYKSAKETIEQIRSNPKPFFQMVFEKAREGYREQRNEQKH